MARTWAVWGRVRGYDRPAAFARKVLVEGDLPEDGIVKESGSWVMRGGPLFWSWYWDEWCSKGLEGPTRLVLTADDGKRPGASGPSLTTSPAARWAGRARTAAGPPGWPPGPDHRPAGG